MVISLLSMANKSFSSPVKFELNTRNKGETEMESSSPSRQGTLGFKVTRLGELCLR